MYTNKDSNLISELRGLFEFERLKPAIRTGNGNVFNLVQLKQVLMVGMVI